MKKYSSSLSSLPTFRRKGYSGRNIKRIKAKKNKPVLFIFKKRFFGVFVLVVFLFGAGVYFFLFSEIFKIKEIKIEGAFRASPSEIKSIVKKELSSKIALVIPQNIIFLKKKEIENAVLNNFSQIKELKIKRKLLSGLVLFELEEKRGAGILCGYDRENKQVENCFYFNEEGIVFDQAKKIDNSKIIIRSEKKVSLGKEAISKDLIKEIEEIKNYLENKEKIGIKEFLLAENDKKIICRTKEGWEIYFKPFDNVSQQLKNLSLSLDEIILPQKESLEYIDLRFGNRVFYK